MNKLKTIVENYLKPELILMDVLEDTRGNYIRVIIDSEGAVTLGETTKLSKKLRDDEEIISRFPNGFRLEVTTPGLDQSLEQPFQYRKNKDRTLKVTYVEDDVTHTLTGKVLDANDSSVTLLDDSVETNLSYNQIIKAKVEISFN